MDKIEAALKKSETIIISARCSITYSGRAESFLAEGDRLIIIKSDKTLLIHQPTGSTPVNYMKEGTTHKIEEKDGKIIIHSSNLAQKEYLDIELFEIYFIQTQELKDVEKIQLNGTEKHMAENLYKNPELVEKGFKPLSMEEHTKFGFIDIFGYDKNNILVVIECKRYAGDPKAVDQLKRYVDKIKSMKGLEKVRGILACPKITPSAKQMLIDFNFEYLKADPPNHLERFNSNQKKIGEY
ncbi:MAG: DUF91 domain-containing protein [bacterium]|nr:DUF91 domain-containing protein [bacterium]